MEVVTVRCPNCNANLDIENRIDSFYCKYCGTRIILSGQSDTAIKVKSVNQLVNRFLDQREAYLKTRAEEEAKDAEFRRMQQEKEDKRLARIIIGSLIVVAICIVMIYVNGKIW